MTSVPSRSMNKTFFIGVVLGFIFSQCFQQGVVFRPRSDGDSQTVVTEADVCTVAHDDSLMNQVIIDGIGIRYPRQEEIGIRREDGLAARQFPEFFHHAGTFSPI